MHLGYIGGLSHGDFNGDGLSDLLIGTYQVSKAYCVFGHRDEWSSFSSADIESGVVPGFVLSTTAKSQVTHVGNGGDMNGDGFDDLLVSDSDGSNPSVAYIVFGVAGTNRTSFSLGSIDGTNGFSLSDGTFTLGYDQAMGSAGDVNGDGLADLAIGSYGCNTNAGRAYILFARNVSASGSLLWPASLDLTTNIDGNNGFIIEGAFEFSYLGRTVVGAGDMNADGFADIFIGSCVTNGGAWVVFGRAAPWESPLNASQLNGTNGFHFALGLNEYWGFSGGGAGDFNGDGFDDVIIGGSEAYNSSGTKTGMAAILFGHGGSWPAEIARSDAVGSFGFQIEGPDAESYFGYSARGAGDVNGDGLADFLDGFALNGTTCEAELPGASSSSSSSSQLSSAVFSSLASSSSSAVATPAVVVIETGSGGGSASDVAAEVAQLLGVDVGQISVVEITPGTFEVTVINEEVAQQLVSFVTLCIDEASDQ